MGGEAAGGPSGGNGNKSKKDYAGSGSADRDVTGLGNKGANADGGPSTGPKSKGGSGAAKAKSAAAGIGDRGNDRGPSSAASQTVTGPAGSTLNEFGNETEINAPTSAPAATFASARPTAGAALSTDEQTGGTPFAGSSAEGNTTETFSKQERTQGNLAEAVAMGGLTFATTGNAVLAGLAGAATYDPDETSLGPEHTSFNDPTLGKTNPDRSVDPSKDRAGGASSEGDGVKKPVATETTAAAPKTNTAQVDKEREERLKQRRAANTVFATGQSGAAQTLFGS